MRKHGSMLLYVHRNRKDGKPRTATSTLTQFLNSEAVKDHFALRPQKRGSLLGTGTVGGRGRDSEGSTADNPEKDRRDHGPPPEQWKC